VKLRLVSRMGIIILTAGIMDLFQLDFDKKYSTVFIMD